MLCTQMGVLAHPLLTLVGVARPPSMWEFVGLYVCNAIFKHLSRPLISHAQSFGTLEQLL